MLRDLIAAIVGSALILSNARCQDEDASFTNNEPSKILAEYKSFATEYNRKKELLRSAPDRHQQAAALAREYSPRFLEMARRNLGDEDAYQPLLWIVVNLQEGKELDAAVRLLKGNFASYDFLWNLIPELEYSRSDEIDRLLNFVIEKTTHKLNRGVACYCLARRTKRRAELAGDVQVAADSARIFERVLREFADQRGRAGSLGDLAKGQLAELQGPRAIGQMAPDIEAADILGQTFKLSDYRGKVVLLDFWGHW